MQSNSKIVQNGTCSNYSATQMRDTETFQVLSLEMLCKLFIGKFIGKCPIIKLKSKIFAAETLLKTLFKTTFKEYFLGIEIYEQFLYVVESTLSNQKFTC